jgi:hypothetical protein
MLGFGAALLAAGYAASEWLTPDEAPPSVLVGDEEERPPVVVGGGSVDIRVEPDGTNHTKGPGSLDRRGSKDTIVYHNHLGSVPPIGLLVTVEGSTTAGCAVTDRFMASKLTVNFGKNSGNKQVDFSIDYSAGLNQGLLMVDAKDRKPEWPTGADVHHVVVKEKDQEQPKESRIWSIDITTHKPRPDRCDFAANAVPKITIRQVFRRPR